MTKLLVAELVSRRTSCQFTPPSIPYGCLPLDHQLLTFFLEIADSREMVQQLMSVTSNGSSPYPLGVVTTPSGCSLLFELPVLVPSLLPPLVLLPLPLCDAMVPPKFFVSFGTLPFDSITVQEGGAVVLAGYGAGLQHQSGRAWYRRQPLGLKVLPF